MREVARLMWSILVHGGAGSIPGELEKTHRAGCAEASAAGAAILEQGGGAVAAACAAVAVLEANPAFNSGVGSTLDARGLPATDAAVMRGSDLGYGAVGQVLGVRSPIALAREVLDDPRHCLLVGPGAVDFARSRGVALEDPRRHVTKKTEAAWRQRKARERLGPVDPAEDWAPQADRGNTVGAVVRDAAGELVAATSTGGIVARYPGRVGDSPIAGAGTYADSALGALSATGHGETMLRTAFAMRTLHALASALDPQLALESALESATLRIGGKGGAIVLLPDGRLLFARNTQGMGVAGQIQGCAPFTGF